MHYLIAILKWIIQRTLIIDVGMMAGEERGMARGRQGSLAQDLVHQPNTCM